MGNYIYDNVVIIGIDGMGNFNKNTETPNMDKIFGKGSQSFYGYSLFPTISAQNWGGMLLGAEPDVHGLTNSIVGSKLYENKELPSLFTAVRKKYPDALLCSYCNWNPINYGIIEHDLGVEMETADGDEALCKKIEECISRKPKLLFIQFDDVDGAGHGHDYGSEKHLEQIRTTDGYIGRIYDAYVKAGIAENTLFIAISDHGGFNHGHGGYTEGEKYIYFALAGKTVKQGNMGTVQAKDISAVVFHAFGIEIPKFDMEGYSSQIPLDAFTDYDGDFYDAKSLEVKVPLDIKAKETPAIDSENGLYSYFKKDDIKFALFFDADKNDATGKVKFEENGHMKFYSTGIMGSMGELGSIGYLRSDDVKFGNSSFTMALWVKNDAAYDDRCHICGTKKHRVDSRGFMISMTAYEIKIYIEAENCDDEESYNVPFNYDKPGHWTHVIISVDKEKMRLDMYVNFEKRKSVKLPEKFNVSLDNEPFIIGNECGLKYNNIENNYIFNIDDLIAFNKSFDEDDTKKLKEYYGL